MATKKSSKKEQPKKEESNSEYSIKDTDKEIAIKYIDDFGNGVKLGIQDTIDSEESKKEQIDFVDNFISDFKSTMTGDNLIIINKFLTEFTSGMAEFLVNKKDKKNNEEISFEFESIEGVNDEYKDFLLPYSIHVKNLTDEKLYDVDLFNYDHEKQNKVAYSCTNGVDYNMFLRFLSSLNEPTERVNLLRLVAVCDYQKFKAKQLRSCISVIYQEPKGRMISTPIQSGIHLSAYQQQSDIIEIPLKDLNKIKLFNQLQLRLSYLMPEAEMHITIFPQKINK